MARSVWVPDRPQRRFLGPLPEGVELCVIPPDAPPRQMREAEFLVPPYDCRAVLELLGEMPALRVIQAVSAGVEWLEPWVPAGVTVCNARGARDLAVAEWVLAVVLAMEKRLPDFVRRQDAREWRAELLGELAGKRAVVVGYGGAGRAVAAKLTAVGVEVLPVASAARAGVHGPQELPSLLGQADIVVLIVPLSESTRGLFDARMLSLMRPGALLVNAARGPVVQTSALIEQLAAGRLRAALDVTDVEPLGREDPLWQTPGVLITPHVAGDTPQSEERVYRLIGEQVRRYFNGQPLLNVLERDEEG